MQHKYCHLAHLLILLAMLLPGKAAHARYEVRVIDTFPAGNDINLGLDENYSLRIQYKTDEPIHIWARPFYQGQEVGMMTNASDVYTGEGEALGWFASREPAEIDEVRILVDTGNSGRGTEAAAYPVKIHIGEGAAPLETRPTWISTMIDKSNQVRREAIQQQMNEPITAGDTALMTAFMLAVMGLGLGGFILPVVAFWRWQGGWRIAAAVPICLMAIILLRIIIDTAIDPTSHNLWPFEIVVFGAVSVGLIVGMKVVQFATRPRHKLD